MSLRDWPILRQLNPEFLDTIHMAMVFGDSGDEALLITDDGDVYGVGSNSHSCLGIGDSRIRTVPAINTTLSGKHIEGFAWGGHNFYECKRDFVIAYDHDGKMYQWGSLIWSVGSISKPQLVDFNLRLKVKAVCCGSAHCMALCDDGKVYTWGENDEGQLGQSKPIDENVSINTPERVAGLIADEIVTGISCGSLYSAVFLADGRVFTWGCNESGELGINIMTTNSASPVEVTSLRNVKIVKIACGSSHALALSSSGDLYLWGNNFWSELGMHKTVARYKEPFKFEMDLRFTDIEASYACHLSVAVCENREIYVWGQTRSDQVISQPMNTRCENIHQVFAFFASPNIMPKPLTESIRGSSIVGTWKNEYRKPDHSDLTIVVDGKEIQVHKTILKMRSKYLSVMLDWWLKIDEKIVTIKEKSYAVIEAYLKYLYTDELEVDLDLAAELLILADEYKDENFKILCERSIKRNMVPEKVAYFLTLTERLETWQNLNKFCLKFGLNNAKKVVKSEAFEMWDPDATRTRAFFVKYIESIEQKERK